MTKGLLIAAGLAGTAGYVNAVAFLGLHAFVAPMTGTVVLAGFALAEANWAEAGWQALVVVGFLGGVTVARLIRRLLSRGPAPCWAVSALLLAAAGVRPLDGLLSLVPIAVALGCLNGSETRFGATTLNTAFLTGNLERLGEAIVDEEFPNRSAQLALIGVILLAYAAGATGGAAAARALGQPLLLPAAALAVAALGSAARVQVRGPVEGPAVKAGRRSRGWFGR